MPDFARRFYEGRISTPVNFRWASSGRYLVFTLWMSFCGTIDLHRKDQEDQKGRDRMIKWAGRLATLEVTMEALHQLLKKNSLLQI